MKRPLLMSLAGTLLLSSCTPSNKSGLETRILSINTIERPKAEVLIEEYHDKGQIGYDLENNIIHPKKDKNISKRDDLIRLFKPFNEYISLIKKQGKTFAKKGAEEKQLSAMFNDIFHKSYDLQFKLRLEDYFKDSAKQPIATIDADILLKSFVPATGLYPSFQYSDVKNIGAVIVPMLFNKFKEKKIKKRIFGESIEYDQVFAEENLLEDICSSNSGRSWREDDAIIHHSETYERLYDIYKSKASKANFKDRYEKLEVKFARRSFGEFLLMPEEEGKKKFIEKLAGFGENCLAASYLFDKTFRTKDIISSRNMSVNPSVSAYKQAVWSISYQLNSTDDIDLLRIWFLRQERNPSSRRLARNILHSYYGCLNSSEFCSMDDKDIKSKTKRFYDNSFKEYNKAKKMHENMQKRSPKYDPFIKPEKDKQNRLIC